MDSANESSGRRQRKKLETRRRIADSARRLFLERGYEAVGIRDIAADADVAVTTVFAHFTSKEALVFERDEVFEQRLALAVTACRPDESVIDRLHSEVEKMVRHCTSRSAQPVWRMVDASEDLRAYEESMLARHADALATAIGSDPVHPRTLTSSRAIARFVISAYALARTSPDPIAALGEVFPMIHAAWQANQVDTEISPP
ncbi:AcrR family transcriptional regulator [Mycobacterium frederiksbergense]|uniref:AcrR family transcriptional regulator n=1 Tax=Mycolicibacterium frederiksbergense TaxID=117567 RepID=A0ABT6KY55_9MYCO|nr:TetR/AcrR family transcriptional regulator [Mycolicibacterium frederiksbergense]MDH6195630.1 AcrR family transcriptional regulator [Mycolicibacterium frederiksbergense]